MKLSCLYDTPSVEEKIKKKVATTVMTLATVALMIWSVAMALDFSPDLGIIIGIYIFSALIARWASVRRKRRKN